MGDIIINRKWEMPNSRTFSIRCIRKLIDKYVRQLPENAVIVDPFANSNRIATITNDLDPQYGTDYHLDATDFLKLIETNSVDLVLYDPPYSPRQVSECYKKLNRTVNMKATQASYWRKQKDEIARILKTGGHCISFGWDSNGIGKKNGFEIVEMLIVAHGGHHNDTICTVDKKIVGTVELFK